jgi:Phosphoenolpyruvate carboxykinase
VTTEKKVRPVMHRVYAAVTMLTAPPIRYQSSGSWTSHLTTCIQFGVCVLAGQCRKTVEVLDCLSLHVSPNFCSCVLWRQDKRKTVGEARSTFMSAMSDAGLKPTVVYHNLSPAVLYEKVRTAHQTGSVVWDPLSNAAGERAWGCTVRSPGHAPPGVGLAYLPPILCWGGLPQLSQVDLHSSVCVIHPAALYYALCPLQALAYEPGSHLVSSGALATLSGAKTGRTPKDKRVVREAESEANVW